MSLRIAATTDFHEGQKEGDDRAAATAVKPVCKEGMDTCGKELVYNMGKVGKNVSRGGREWLVEERREERRNGPQGKWKGRRQSALELWVDMAKLQQYVWEMGTTAWLRWMKRKWTYCGRSTKTLRKRMREESDTRRC